MLLVALVSACLLPSQPPKMGVHCRLGGKRCVQPSGGPFCYVAFGSHAPCHPSLPSLPPSSIIVLQASNMSGACASSTIS
jgi:hypothetical protein